VGTAKAPRRLKKRKKKKSDRPAELGAIALAEARLPEEHGLTLGEWKDAIVARGAQVASVFKRAPKPAADAADATGAKQPDEIDGVTVPKRKKRRARKSRRPQATLWASAKQSFKETVKESVREEVKSSAVGSALSNAGGALDALKNVGAKVKDGASELAASAGKAARDEKLAGRFSSGLANGLSEAKTVLGAALETVKTRANTAIAERAADAPAAPDDAPHAPADLTDARRDEDAGEIERAPEAVSAEPNKKPGIDVEVVRAEASHAAAEVAKKVSSGIDAVSSWLKASAQGERAAAPYSKRRARAAGDVVEANVVEATVVEAKDAPDNAAASDGGTNASAAEGGAGGTEGDGKAAE
jgi:hypothetical protein